MLSNSESLSRFLENIEKENENKWQGYSNNGVLDYRCPKCGEPKPAFAKNTNYCPNCGAKLEN